MTTYRQQIIAAIIARLELIKTTNTYQLGGAAFNYETNIGDKVEEWRAADIDERELPMLVVRDIDLDMSVDSDTTEIQLNELLIVVEIVTSGVTSAIELRKMFGDVWAAIKQDDTLGELVKTCKPKKERVIVEQANRKIAGGLIEFTVKYFSTKFNAYGFDAS